LRGLGGPGDEAIQPDDGVGRDLFSLYRRFEDDMEGLAERDRLCQDPPRAGGLAACQPRERKRVLRAENVGMVCPSQQIAKGVKVFPSLGRSRPLVVFRKSRHGRPPMMGSRPARPVLSDFRSTGEGRGDTSCLVHDYCLTSI
jgi:hypothetical protein